MAKKNLEVDIYPELAWPVIKPSNFDAKKNLQAPDPLTPYSLQLIAIYHSVTVTTPSEVNRALFEPGINHG